jgi:septal ring factor EnvC (AmiA/AmiB activator)
MIDIDTKTVLTRKEKEEVVLDLYFNQNKTIREIAKTARKSPRDIGEIINRAIKEKERQEHKSLVVQAYELFRQGKKPLEVAIILNIGQMQVTQYYTEYLKLIQHDAIVRIHEELGDNIGHFVNLCRASKSANMGVQQVINLLIIANNYLPLVQCKYEQLQKENYALEFKLRVSSDQFQNLNDQIIDMSKRIEAIRLEYENIKSECDKEKARLQDIKKQIADQEAIVKNSEDSDDYTKIIKVVREIWYYCLSNAYAPRACPFPPLFNRSERIQ